MNPNDFSDKSPGRLVKIPEGTWAFVPSRMPRQIEIPAPIPTLIEQASRDLGRLFEIADRLPNPSLLIDPLIKKEAEFSSRIEGTIATQEELALFETLKSSTFQRPEVREVHNYVEALKHGLHELNKLPICLRLISDLHGRLMAGVRGHDQRPAEFRTVQNQVSKPNQSIAEARYVPPPVAEMTRCLEDFEKDVHESKSGAIPQLVQAALLHYQFEAIHPFRGGNGRIGRMLIPLFLAERKLLPNPLLHVSAYLEAHRDEYIHLLLSVSQKGTFELWIEFFLKGMSHEANRTIKFCGDILNLRQKYMSQVQQKRASALLQKLVDSLFIAPITTIPIAAVVTGLTYPAAKANILRLQKEGILDPMPGNGVKLWRAHEIMRLLSW